MRTASIVCLICACVSGIPAKACGWGGKFPPEELIGTWEDMSKFSRHGMREMTMVTITILPDGRVEGTAGGAKLTGCVVKKNRGWLGRRLNIKTDYIIRGCLEGAVVPGDSGGMRKIAIPFNIRDGKLAGGLGALTQRWWECCPSWLFVRLRLPKQI